MKERPILFSAPMVLALLAGTKTQTRRAVKGRMLTVVEERMAGVPFEPVVCPYGLSGDRLWVREAWQTTLSLDHLDAAGIAKASAEANYERPWCPLHYNADGHRTNWDAAAFGKDPGRQRNGRFMPRWASRIDLEITDVRVERLQAITLDDARAEGIPQTAGEAHAAGLYDMSKEPGHEWDNRTSVENYARLWDQINGAGSWAADPWVWVLTFRRC